MGRSGWTGERGAALGHGSSGGMGEGSGQLRWAGFLTGGVIRRRLDRWAGPMSDGDAAMRVAPRLGSAVFSMSSKRSYKKRTEVAVNGGKGLKGCMQLPVEVACASL